MHWAATQPGMLDAERELRLIEQSPGEILFLSAADTDLSNAAAAWGPRFGPRLRLAHAASLRQPVAADDYLEKVIRHARLVVIRLLGGQSYFPHLLQALLDRRFDGDGPLLLLLSGTDTFDDQLAEMSSFPVATCQKVFGYFQEGGRDNYLRAGEALEKLLTADSREVEPESLPPAIPMPMTGIYHRSDGPSLGHVLITFYRAWYQAGDLAVVDALIHRLEAGNLGVTALYAYSLKEPSLDRLIREVTAPSAPNVILTLQSFSATDGAGTPGGFLGRYDCPILQAVVSTGTREEWQGRTSGLTPAETAINVALPEIDGRVFTTVVGFKEERRFVSEFEFTVKHLVPEAGQIAFVTEVMGGWVRLRRLSNTDKKVAIILSNYPNRNGRIGNGVGLDTPASALALLRALQEQGYSVGTLPSTSAELMELLQAGQTNDPVHSYGKPCHQMASLEKVQQWVEELPDTIQQRMFQHWPDWRPEPCPIAGRQFGQVFVGIQPPRGFSLQAQAIYHSPDLPPPPLYLAFYRWIQKVFRADAVIHLGKHGNLEWLPGRSVALGPEDWPQICLGAIPNLYPFIVNNPGEGTQAKRRIGSVIIDHLTPPLTRSGLYGELEQLERLLEEHAQAVSLYPIRAGELEQRIEELLSRVPWRAELPSAPSLAEAAGNYLCEIKESQIRSGLHILGTPPEGQKRIDFLQSILRLGSGNRPGLLEALHGKPVDWPSLGPAQRDSLDRQARAWIENELAQPSGDGDWGTSDLQHLSCILRETLEPRVGDCERELTNLLASLSGRFVPPGPAGAPSRGRLDVLPTGRNFYALDPRVLPTPTAWDCGRKMAERVLEKYRQETGEPLLKMALVIWGTSNMRTGGDDIAQALWLWGCEPVWDVGSGRVIDFAIVPASRLGRPRVDLVLRVSGLFRDAFGDLARLLATVPKRLALLDEPGDLNPIRQASLVMQQELVTRGESESKAQQLAALRVFSSGPGCYGTGLLPLIDSQQWQTSSDLAEVFCKWGGHALASDGSSSEQIELLQNHLRGVEVVHQNQDNREHDILDSDDYFQFQGGLHATVAALRGTAPRTYHGDSSEPDRPKVRALAEELSRVLRSRVFNPKWIEAMREHGYKGAFEMAATVDYLFGYGATTPYVQNHHYEETARRLLLDPVQQAFFRDHNPAALQEATQRCLEAHARGLWPDPSPPTLQALEQTLLDLEGDLE